MVERATNCKTLIDAGNLINSLEDPDVISFREKINSFGEYKFKGNEQDTLIGWVDKVLKSNSNAKNVRNSVNDICDACAELVAEGKITLDEFNTLSALLRLAQEIWSQNC